MSLSDDEKDEKKDQDQDLSPVDSDDDANFPVPKAKMHAMLEKFELFAALQQRGGGSLDLGAFSDSQRDKLLDIIEKNEDNAFNFHTRRLEAAERIEQKRIGASTIDKRTGRYIAIFILTIFLIITLAILFYKDEYFDTWLAFIIGLLGGAGGVKLLEKKSSNEPSRSFLEEDSSEKGK